MYILNSRDPKIELSITVSFVNKLVLLLSNLIAAFAFAWLLTSKVEKRHI